MLHLVMDSAGDMPANWALDFDINVIPVNIQFRGKTFLQGVELSDEEFYRLADESDEIPKTSQPTPYQFIEFYKKIAKVGDTILSMHVTSKLSGTFESAVIAAKELKDQFNIFPLDSASGSAALGFMCKEARLMDRAGASIKAILERMEFIRQNVNIVLTLDNLEYARKSGRVKTLQAVLASMLSLKPIVILHEGALDVAERVRTRQKSISRIIEIVLDRVGNRKVNVAVVHARSPNEAKTILDRIQGIMNCNELIITDLSIGVAANLGPGTVGIIAYPMEEG